MSLIKSKAAKVYRWQKGDLITTSEAAELLGYRSPKILQDDARRKNLMKEFEALHCTLTDSIWIGGGRRFLRSEIDLFLTRKLETLHETQAKRQKDLRLAA